MIRLSENIEKIAHKPPVFARTTDSVSQIIETLEQHHINHLPITDKDKVVGVISKQDLFKNILYLSKITTGKTYNKILLDQMTAREVMTPEPVTILLDDSIKYAQELLLQGEFHCLPVVSKDNSLVGMVTTFDILKYYSENLSESKM